MFSSSHPEDLDTLFEDFTLYVTAEMNDELVASVSDVEIK